jgi:hypothetical protein
MDFKIEEIEPPVVVPTKERTKRTTNKRKVTIQEPENSNISSLGSPSYHQPSYPTNNVKNEVLQPKLSYEDILSKLGMYVSGEQLYLMKTLPKEKQVEIVQKAMVDAGLENPKTFQQQYHQPVQNSYIHNKYFKDTMNEPQIKRPQTLGEYRNMLAQQIIDRRKAQQIQKRWRQMKII